MWTESDYQKYQRIQRSEWKYQKATRKMVYKKPVLPPDWYADILQKDIYTFQMRLNDLRKRLIAWSTPEKEKKKLEYEIDELDKRRIKAANILNGFPPKPYKIRSI